MEENYILYQKFNSKELASPVVELLNQHFIPFELIESKLPFDPSNLSGHAKPDFSLKLKPEDFEKVELLLFKNAEQSREIIKDHYLQKFSDEELMDLIIKPDEWSKNDFQIARYLLKERGKEVNEDLINALRKQRIEDLAKPEGSQKSWIIAGYLFSFLGGIIGVFIGLHLWTATKVLPNGKKVYSFTLEDRMQGKIIFFTGIVLCSFWIILKVFIEIENSY